MMHPQRTEKTVSDGQQWPHRVPFSALTWCGPGAVCYHGGYSIRAQRPLQRNFADPPSDSAAVLDWSVGQSFMPTSRKPPLAIAMQSSREGDSDDTALLCQEGLPSNRHRDTKVLNKLDKSLRQYLPGSR